MCREKLIGKKIKTLRKGMGLTQEQLAEKANIDSKHLSKIENGLHFPSYKTLAKLAEILHFNLEQNDNEIFERKNPLYLKSLKILNSAKSEVELSYYFEVLKLAHKGLSMRD